MGNGALCQIPETSSNSSRPLGHYTHMPAHLDAFICICSPVARSTWTNRWIEIFNLLIYLSAVDCWNYFLSLEEAYHIDYKLCAVVESGCGFLNISLTFLWFCVDAASLKALSLNSLFLVVVRVSFLQKRYLYIIPKWQILYQSLFLSVIFTYSLFLKLIQLPKGLEPLLLSYIF